VSFARVPLSLLLILAVAAEPPPKAADIDRLIKQLGSEDFNAREAASKALRAIGEPALPALRKAGESNDAEVRRRARDLADAIDPPPPALVVINCNPDKVCCLGLSPDGRRLASGGTGGMLRVWDAATGIQLSAVRGHDHVSSLTFGTGGRVLASAGQDGTAKLWHLPALKEGLVLRAPGDCLLAVALSADGKTLAAGGKAGTVGLWDTATGKQRAELRGHEGWVLSLAFSPDGATVASAGWDGVRLWDVAGRKGRATLDGHTGSVRAVCISADGSAVASGSNDGTVRVWDVRTGRHRRKLAGGDAAIFDVALPPDGKGVVWADGGERLTLWDARTGKAWASRPVVESRETVVCVAMSANGRVLAAGCTRDHICLWSVKALLGR
jgi:WD40 repeat protein